MENREMIPKSFLILSLLVGTMLFSGVGCGRDAEAPEKSIVQQETIVESSTPSISNQGLLGSWKVVLIFGTTPEAYLESLSPDGMVEEKVKQFDFRFAADHSWTCNFASETVLVSPDVRPGTSKSIGVWSGTYVFDGLTLTLRLKGSTVKLTPKPDDLFQQEFGLTLVEAKDVYDEGFRADVLNPFLKSTWTQQAGRLIFRTPTGEKMVLAKK